MVWGHLKCNHHKGSQQLFTGGQAVSTPSGGRDAAAPREPKSSRKEPALKSPVPGTPDSRCGAMDGNCPLPLNTVPAYLHMHTPAGKSDAK